MGCLLLLQLGYGLWRVPQVDEAIERAEDLRVALVQPNLGIEDSGNGATRRERLRMLSDMSAAATGT